MVPFPFRTWSTFERINIRVLSVVSDLADIPPNPKMKLMFIGKISQYRVESLCISFAVWQTDDLVMYVCMIGKKNDWNNYVGKGR